MAVERYFEKFPQITYSNNVVVDITKRAVLLDRVSSNPYVFYPYEIATNERADQFSSRYYKDPYSSWMLYIANKITDPYYEWYLSNDEFSDFIIKKYESIVTAQQKIKYYRNNWITAVEQNITVSEWNALTYSQQNYWEAEFDNNNRVKYYKRKQKDWKFGTNKIVKYVVNATSFELSSLIKDEIVNIVFDPSNIGNGQLLKVDPSSNSIYLQHMRGTFKDISPVTITASSYIYSTESNVNTVFASVTSIANNIPTDLDAYYDGVTYYDYEVERNEYNKTIRVMDSDLRETMAENLKNLMTENF